MKSVSLYDIKGKTAGKVTLDQSYFDQSVNKTFLHRVSVQYLTNQRQGNAATKTRKDIRGGGRKPWRQKGTGRARFGSIRNPVWRGGGVVFGPHPKNYRTHLPKNARDLALCQSLNAKFNDHQLIVVDQLPQGTPPKTKAFAGFLKALKAESKSLVITEQHNQNIVQSARNIPGTSVKAFNNVNAMDVLQHKKVIFSKQALENLIKLRKR
ncbi:50S ribosomal protein L4 [Candidatus Omnitrophota bacterium]